ncbi:ROK family transcriptional regulator [Paenibacillus tuaregi]|uniref:ROK family transcriptional regulator n=1 Tax=Paenibacillus tuaregi TaxID=1816681 RepID=UPI0008387E09|nr:ROK family transcriptional regulator [Paenibacillus tuaregi]
MQQLTGDQSLVKQINSSIVLDLVRTYSPISRAEVSVKSGLNKGTVSNLVNQLIESGLVRELGQGESSGGRKPVLLEFNQQAGYAIGVDVRVDMVSLVLCDLHGNVVDQAEHTFDSRAPEHVYQVLAGAVRHFIHTAPKSHYGIVGIGAGVPGIVDGEGNVLFAPNLEWRDVPLGRWLREEFLLPVAIDNEANAGALGERQYGAGQDSNHLVYLSVSHGIGTGIVIGEGIYKGAYGYSGEAGHTTIEVDGKLCSCGNYGCWELYASERALMEEAGRSGSLMQAFPPGKITAEGSRSAMRLEHLIQLAEGGNPEAETLLKNNGRYLGIGIANLINIFNPELIIIGNRIALAEAWIADEIKNTVQARALPFHKDKVRIEFSHLSMGAVMLGAASMALNHFFDKMRVSVEKVHR